MKTILMLLLACSTGLLGAQVAADTSGFESASSYLYFDGLVLDQTRSRTGREFYEQFYAQWAERSALMGETDILLEEQPARGRLGFLEIKVNDSVVVAYHLQPGDEWMELAVQQAVERLINYFQNIEQMQKDLESQDQAGSGIY